MKTIPLSQNQIAVIDDEDFELVRRFNWYAHKEGQTYYAYANLPLRNGKKTPIKMHRLIMRALPRQKVDHEDNNGLNNTRKNLRIATVLQNAQNQRLRRDSTSGFKGVYFHKQNRRWNAYITVKKRRISLGLYDKPEEAAKAYDRAAREHFGQYAKTNFNPTEDA